MAVNQNQLTNTQQVTGDKRQRQSLIDLSNQKPDTSNRGQYNSAMAEWRKNNPDKGLEEALVFEKEQKAKYGITDDDIQMRAFSTGAGAGTTGLQADGSYGGVADGGGGSAQFLNSSQRQQSGGQGQAQAQGGGQGQAQGGIAGGMFNFGNMMEQFYNWKPDANDDEGRAIKNTTQADMVNSAFQSQLAQMMAQSQAGISKDMMNFQSMLERQSAGEARAEEYKYGMQSMGAQFEHQNNFASAQHERDIGMLGATGQQERLNMQKQGNEDRLTQIEAGEQNRLSIGAQGQQDRANIQTQGEQNRQTVQAQGEIDKSLLGMQGEQAMEQLKQAGVNDKQLQELKNTGALDQIKEQGGIDKWMQSEQGKQALQQIGAQGNVDLSKIGAQGLVDKANIDAQGYQDRQNIKTQQQAQADREVGNIKAQGEADQANILTQQTAQGERERGNITAQGDADVKTIGAQGDQDRKNIGAQGDQDVRKIGAQGDDNRRTMEKEDELTAKRSNRQQARARSLARAF